MLGDLRQYLPVKGKFDQCKLEVPPESTVDSALQRLRLPDNKPYIVLLNGALQQESDYSSTNLQTDDEITVFPPIKGG